MAPIAANPEASLDVRPGDETLTPAELKSVSLFADLKRAPSFEKFPGALVLRRYARGDAIVRQGEAGWTAFYILTSEDLVTLRRVQLAQVQAELSASEASRRQELAARQAALEHELAHLSTRTAVPADERAKEPAVTARLDVELSSRTKMPGVLSRLFGRGRGRTEADRRPDYVPNDGATDIALSTRQAPMYEGDLFGEMSCLNRVPRSATVIADRDCYLLEMLRNILDQVRRDPGFKEKSDCVYRRRALGPQLRRFSIFAQLTEQQFDGLRQQVELATFPAGGVIFNEGDASDAFYVIRSGMVKIVKNLPTPRTLTYLGRGDFFGEAGALLGQPRSATAIASGHPQATEGLGSDVELVRIGRDYFLDLCRSSSELQALFAAQRKRYEERERQQTEAPAWDPQQPVLLHPQFEELGLLQGQKLMLVDLDRCTRCGDCMQACVNTHQDGVSRLYLDGPRFGKYLVPNACRKCLDPVCMIGCPVGSIVRGEAGEIVIKDWCIGCGLCADQCPYGSIHMHPLAGLNLATDRPSHTPASADAREKEVSERAVVCDLCAGLDGMGPACVYHCPHDAAIRIDARYDFPGTC
ncbi:MAG TPA: cyclic nucleotide-binding domain-containing protein [Pirellulales bacterium]|nr:cyclic nucleotide-binding domain-containing protein [Pirellulales bacterium]